MNKAYDKIKKAFEDNPLGVLAVGAFVATAATKLMNANTERKNAKTWEKEVRRRIQRPRR